MPNDAAQPWEYVVHIPHDPRAVTVCRHTLRVVLTLHGLARVTDIAELLATELVANAVRHTKGPVAFRLLWADGVLRIGTWDADPTPPAPPLRPALDLEEQGRGLDLVRACADTWGWHPLPGCGDAGKYVWCELGAA
ncbi:ATP-binding protein [Streptomyces flavofungini]|uniref:ATP-binding protein n=1 Tax=Streptomyces flavofungini TaxID=68200 RepID=UPI0025B10AEF|nr:ATP-binding protein [Streptomyces flavofungini]WJV48665.1 ATP-binding protein [Streptomyces flavofungini]